MSEPAAAAPAPVKPPVIAGPPDHYHGPSTGLSTEKGDSWHTAVEKINGAFKTLFASIEGDAKSVGTTLDAGAVKIIDSIDARVTALEAGFEHLIAALTPGNAATPPIVGVQALDPDGKPATVRDPQAADPNAKPAA